LSDFWGFAHPAEASLARAGEILGEEEDVSDRMISILGCTEVQHDTGLGQEPLPQGFLQILQLTAIYLRWHAENLQLKGVAHNVLG
jgi:hypothetical protein